MATAFKMPDSIAGEKPAPATVPFKKPEESARMGDEKQSIRPQIFFDFEDAEQAYEKFIETCNWKKNPTFAFYVWASEQNWLTDDETGDDVRLDERDENFYSFDAWREDMQTMTDERFKMVDEDLVKYETTRIGDYAIQNGTVPDDVPAPTNLDDSTPATESAEPTAAASDDNKFWREMEVLAEIRAAEMKRQEAQTDFDVAKEEMKEAKEHLASCTAALARATAKLTQLGSIPEQAKTKSPASIAAQAAATSTGLADQSKPESSVDQGGSVESPTAASQASTANQDDDNAWRNGSTADIIKGLPGLGKKKFEAIVELAPTVGDLEDLRSEAAKAFEPFKAKLPDGCGTKIADAIENALLEYIGRFGQQVKKAKAAEAEAIEAEAAEPTPAPQAESKPDIDAALADL